MMTYAIPANGEAMPAVCLSNMQGPAELATHAALIGTTTADATAMLFRLPLPAQLLPIFEDAIRREVSADLLTRPYLRAADRRQLEDVAWTAFCRRMARKFPHIDRAPIARELV